jgi:hypothetical protein
MQMGGFMLYLNGARKSVTVDYKLVARYITDQRFILPSTEEIQDRSKGDGLSKALAVGQTGWFIAQCISRWAAGLAITEMELVTLAFAALNGLIYFLWWNKPLDVRYAVPVMLQSTGEPPAVFLLSQCPNARNKMSQMTNLVRRTCRASVGMSYLIWA